MIEIEDFELYAKMYKAMEHLENCREFATLIPEVRSNLVYAKKGAKTPDDVLAIDGRITVVNNIPHASGRIRFGASSHMARLIIEVMKREPSIRAGINFACNTELVEWLKQYCKKRRWLFGIIDRTKEPKDIAEAHEASMPWKVKEAIRSIGGNVPKVFHETGAVGKEPVSVIVGRDPIEVVSEVCEIAREYAMTISPNPKVGKIDLDTFNTYILKRLGKKDSSVIVPPMIGVDSGVIDIGDEKVLIIAEDPIFSIPGQPLEMFGWYTVHIGASDVAVMGVKPRYMTYTLLMPPDTSDKDFRTIIDSIHRTALELDIAIVGGHTGHYPGFASPTIGGVAVFSISHKGEYITPAGAEPGDDVILTKGPAIETAGILSVMHEEDLLRNHPRYLVEKAKALCKQMTVVNDCMIAMEVGGVTSMHDATEGGVIGGLFEIANASGVGMEIDESKFIYPDEVRIVCEHLDIDPISAIAEGSLLITAKHTHSERIIKRLNEVGILSSIIGVVTDNPKMRILKRTDGSTTQLAIPEQDPFWPAFFKALER